jgi:hypothetical protein
MICPVTEGHNVSITITSTAIRARMSGLLSDFRRIAEHEHDVCCERKR